jgi:hypothetical protein
MAAAAPARSRWLFGPVPDLLLGCGVAYLAVFALLTAQGAGMQALLPIGFAPLVYLVTSAPHYGATLLRVYERREDRSSYVFFSVWATLALAALFFAGLHSVVVGSWILTIYLTWSPWHYSGQNYGIALLFLRRRGVEVTPGAKRLLRTSFWLSFALTFLALHGAEPAASYAPQGFTGMVYQLLPLGLPTPVVSAAMSAVGAVYALVLAAVAVQLLRRAPLRDLAPALVLIGTQALWFSVPPLVRQFGVLQGVDPLSAAHASYAFVWIAVGHALQYLWITAYYARSSGRAPRLGGFYARALLAGIALWTLPTLVFAPGVLGRLPYDAGLAMLVGAIVNLHHFVLDGAIWKLRDSRIARVLIRPAEATAALATAPASLGRRLSPWPLIAVAGLASIAIEVTTILVSEVDLARAVRRGDPPRAQAAVARLASLGRDSPAYHVELARLWAREGRLAAALAQAESSLALHPTTPGWVAKGELLEATGRLRDALDAYQSAVELDPRAVAALYRAGVARLRVGEREEARRLLTAAAGLAPANAQVRQALAEASAPSS